MKHHPNQTILKLWEECLRETLRAAQELARHSESTVPKIVHSEARPIVLVDIIL